MGKKFKKIKILKIIGLILILFLVLIFPNPTKIEKSYPNENTANFENLIKPDKYQIFVFDCPAYVPFNFARHPWFVLNKMGQLSRWEVRQEKENGTNNHLYLNAQTPFQGINVSFIGKKYYWKSELLGYLEGDENSVAKRAIDFVENSKETYPFQYEYSLKGPNSNTYLKWVLDKFPEFNIKLSWRFIGKDYK